MERRILPLRDGARRSACTSRWRRWCDPDTVLFAANVDKADRAHVPAAAHVKRLVAHRDLGMFLLDPLHPSERSLRVVADKP